MLFPFATVPELVPEPEWKLKEEVSPSRKMRSSLVWDDDDKEDTPGSSKSARETRSVDSPAKSSQQKKSKAAAVPQKSKKKAAGKKTHEYKKSQPRLKSKAQIGLLNTQIEPFPNLTKPSLNNFLP